MPAEHFHGACLGLPEAHYIYNPETGEKLFKNVTNVQFAEDWKKQNPGKDPHPPTIRCESCNELRFISAYTCGPMVRQADVCDQCHEAVRKYTLKKRLDIEALAKKAVKKYTAKEVRIIPPCGRGDRKFEEAIWQAEHEAHGDEGMDSIEVCILCDQRLENVYSPKVDMDTAPHFHMGGVCDGCMMTVLVEQESPDDIDCPLCLHEDRRKEHVARLQFPYFVFNPHLTAIAHVASVRSVGEITIFRAHNAKCIVVEKATGELAALEGGARKRKGADASPETEVVCVDNGPQPRRRIGLRS
eukprot:jgi/Mesvir1/22988/Mv05682-RA.1